MIKVAALTKKVISDIEPRSVYDGDITLKYRLMSLVGASGVESAVFLNKRDKPIAIIGYSLLWPGVAEAWAVTTDLIDKDRFSFCKKVREYLDFSFNSMGIKRMHITVKNDYLEGMQFARFLKFKPEAFLAKYGPDGSDYIQYVRF